MIKKYGQLKRAVQRENLIRVRRGLYCLGKNLSLAQPNVFELAQKIYWPSYVSLE